MFRSILILALLSSTTFAGAADAYKNVVHYPRQVSSLLGLLQLVSTPQAVLGCGFESRCVGFRTLP